MQQSAKYLIHAEIRTSGVVERSDVVGAVFGQTEGLLGEELDLRELQESSKVGRIDVDIESADGRSFGAFTVASGLDRVETAVLAASFETIDRVGPCRAECTIVDIEDVRAAKRRTVVNRATELLTEFEEGTVTGSRLIEEVRKRARVEEITEYAGLPAGPHVASSDAIIVVEGRADVRQLLRYGIKNAIAVEGTNISEELGHLTSERTTTAFLDGDRGGDLILRELEQIADIDYVAFAPTGRSVEDLNHNEVRAALRKKIPFEQVTNDTTAREAFAPTDGGVAVDPTGQTAEAATREEAETVVATATRTEETADEKTEQTGGEIEKEDIATESTAEEPASDDTIESEQRTTETLTGHVKEIVGSETVRLLDSELAVLEETAADDAFDAVADSDTVPQAVVLDGPVTQRLLDIAAQRGVEQIVGTATETFVKQPMSVRVRTTDQLL